MSLKNIKSEEQLRNKIREKLNNILIPKLAKLLKSAHWLTYCRRFRYSEEDFFEISIGRYKFFTREEDGINSSDEIHVSNFYKLVIPDSVIAQFAIDVLNDINLLEKQAKEIELILNHPATYSRELLIEKTSTNEENWYKDL